MKNFKYIFFIVSALSLTSCESLLNEDPQYTINTKVQYNSVENAQKALLGCYGYMTADNAYGQAWQEVTIGYSSMGWVQTSSSSTDKLASLDGDPTEQINSMAWKGMYKVIGEANAFIANIEASPLSDEVKIRMEAEARFLRALAYYNLAVSFGDLPLKTTPSAHDGVAVPRSPKAEVFEQVRLDWEYAFTNLPEKNDDGYATKWAAKAYLGKLYHTLGCQGDNTAWSKAKECFDEAYGKYRLESKFGNLFVDNVKGVKESIFQVNFVLAGASTRNRGSWLVAPSGSCNGQAFDRIRGSKALHDYFIATYPGDPRFEMSYFSKWRAYGGVGTGVKPQVEPIPTPRDSGYAYPYFVYTKRGEAKPAGWKNVKQYVGRLPYEKFANPASPSMKELLEIMGDTATDYQRGLQAFILNATTKPSTNTKSWPYFKKPFDPNQSGNNSHKNLILYRYADMLLMMADVYNEMDQKDKAIDLVDEVLARARRSGTQPAVEPAKWSTGLSKEQVREKIFFERILEGIGEPEMYQKMRLRGTEMLKKVLELNNNHGIILESVAKNPARNGNWGERVFNKGNLNDVDFLKKNLLLPIPKDEIDTNSSIDFTDNNFGY
ncbi:MAG: RagB/SusD family nutrient uptake outer membrane protein [Bacteroides sp.]|uniref:RagB/SusD family nutrient uptake outer membrane protein n=1 Tax=Bacteroides sp. TaxID=29523 RepID=UPI002FC83B55